MFVCFQPEGVPRSTVGPASTSAASATSPTRALAGRAVAAAAAAGGSLGASNKRQRSTTSLAAMDGGFHAATRRRSRAGGIKTRKSRRVDAYLGETGLVDWMCLGWVSFRCFFFVRCYRWMFEGGYFISFVDADSCPAINQRLCFSTRCADVYYKISVTVRRSSHSCCFCGHDRGCLEVNFNPSQIRVLAISQKRWECFLGWTTQLRSGCYLVLVWHHRRCSEHIFDFEFIMKLKRY